jgi:hypothetical protein
MLFEELPDWITPMLTCSVNIQPDSVATKLAIKISQHFEKTFSVAAFRLDHPGTTQKRSHPAGNIQTFLMLAGCRNFQPLSDKRPAATKSRMYGITAFVLKDNGFFRTQRFEFFLGSWQTSLRPRPLLGDMHGWLASNDIRADASNTGLDGLSVLSRTDAVNELPKWGHPTAHDLIQTSGAIPPEAVLTERRSSASSELDGQAAFSGQELRRRSCLLPASSGLRSSGFGPRLLRSNPVVALPVPKGEWLSLCQPRLLAPSRRGPATALWTPLVGLQGMFSCP